MEQYKRQCELVKEFEVNNRILKEELTYYRNNYPDFEKVLEQKLSLQRENAQAQQLKVAYRKLQEENERLQNERKEWAQYLESSDTADQLNTPRDIIYRLAHEKQAIQESQSQVQQLKERLERSEARDVELNNKLEESHAKIAELETLAKKNEVEKEVAVQEKQLIILHRDMLASQVASMSKLEEEATTSEDKTFPLTHRIEELESLLKEYQGQLAQTKNTLIRERAQRATAPPPSSSSSFVSSSGGVESQQQHATDERILELKSSPANIEQQCRSEELSRLRTENRQLLAQLLLYQQDNYDDTVDVGEKRKREVGGSSSGEQLGDGHTIKIPRVTLDTLEQDKEQLKSEKAGLEKRIRRLNEKYGVRHQATLDQIERLLGYKLIFTQDNIKISSAAVDSDQLLFIYTVDEFDRPKLRVSGAARNDYMEYLRGTYDTFIGEQGNIPAFLSSVTLELTNIHAAQWDAAQESSGIFEETSETYYDTENAYDHDEGQSIHMDEGEYYEEGEVQEEEEEYYDDEEYDEMNENDLSDQSREGPGYNHDEPITIDDDDD
ncbi:hypothetical protein BDB00DRAFT_472600 [Zychaea mexicana]|uniref:uncharacterized protein n=1 Tax=Zychaea mexicana TaxID=64656 RepID=UPI0022FEA236|nr:uncharacterized protein BDB00DRAFT_472600 [Zychaea mexicana]KAI9491781.1 hypothetical protein BDB00DRAFT_472600 [Zychaea mexicana]